MNFTDKDAIKLLKKADSFELDEIIGSFPESEREGLSDMEILKRELSDLVDRYLDENHVNNEALRDARAVIRRTNNGKKNAINPHTGRPYESYEFDIAKDTINEYNRLKKLDSKLKKDR